jgi:hypothetical protein
LQRDGNFWVTSWKMVAALGQRELLVLGYLGSADPADHPSCAELGTNLGIQGKRTQKILDDLLARRILFRDFAAYGRRDKSLWHLSHPGWWQGCEGFAQDTSTTNPSSYQSLAFIRDRDRKRINDLRSFILAQNDTVRVPNLLFKMPVSWRAKYLYIQLLFLGDSSHPTFTELADSFHWGWRTVKAAMLELDKAGMIVIQTTDERRFTRWKRHYIHLTDCHDWSHVEAKVQFSAPRNSRARSLNRTPTEPRWREIRKRNALLAPTEIERDNYTVSFQYDGEQYSAPFFCANGNYETANRNYRAAFGNCEAAELSLITPVQAPARKGSGTYKKAYKESQQECIRVRARADDVEISLARAISIADGAKGVWHWDSYKCDKALWTEEVLEFATVFGQADARRLVDYVNAVFEARNFRPIPYNVTSIRKVVAGFLEEVPAAAFGQDGGAALAAKPALECEVLAHPSYSSATAFTIAADGTLPLPSTEVGSAEPGPISAASEAQPESVDLPVAPDRDPLANLPADEDRLRWLAGKLLPKLGKSQKADLRDLWQKHGPRGGVRRFAGRSDGNRLAVMEVSEELTKVGILRSADVPRLPWEASLGAEAELRPAAMNPPSALESPSTRGTDSHSTLLSDFRECQERMLAGQKPAENAPITRARLNNAFAVLARDMKFGVRTRMHLELGRLSDSDLWRRLAETFTEPRLREVLRDIP